MIQVINNRTGDEPNTKAELDPHDQSYCEHLKLIVCIY